MTKLFYNFLLKISGWRIFFNVPPGIKKYVIAVAPHTSNFDFFIGLMARGSLGLNAYFLGKDSLFRFPLGLFFKFMGGIPVDRSKNTNMVDQISKLAIEKEEFILALSPEGTRKKVEKWKSGFYYIALNSNIPIIFASMDWKNHEVRFREPFYPSGNFDQDMIIIADFFKGVKGFRELN
jgi:1-acyl-sn-glycerol-3-phosphate acyltransferase